MSRWVTWIIGALIGLSLIINAVHLWRFVNAGARFTADDGQRLCERLAEHGFMGCPVGRVAIVPRLAPVYST